MKDPLKETIKTIDNRMVEMVIATNKGQKVDESLLIKTENDFRWINKNLDKEEVIEYIKRDYTLQFQDTIIHLLNSPEYDPKRYN